MRCFHKHSGFTLTEALVSVSILAILGTISIFDLRASRRVDELNTAARYLAADLRSLQARALTAKNIKTCLDGGNVKIVCENSSASCAGACTPEPPAAIGVSFAQNASTFSLYAKLDSASTDWTNTSAVETVEIHSFRLNGAPNVIIDNLDNTFLPGRADISFMRQSGSTRLNACVACLEPGSISIRLKHTESNATRIVKVNGITGRISIE